jgi:hypothetical protein
LPAAKMRDGWKPGKNQIEFMNRISRSTDLFYQKINAKAILPVNGFTSCP